MSVSTRSVPLYLYAVPAMLREVLQNVLDEGYTHKSTLPRGSYDQLPVSVGDLVDIATASKSISVEPEAMRLLTMCSAIA